MNIKSLKTLEYDKIIAQLKEYASSPLGRDMCGSLLPSTDIHEIRQAQSETTDALTRVRMKGSISFSGLKDITGSLKRLEIGSSLSVSELLSLSSNLTLSARAKSYGRHEESELPDDSLEEMFRLLEPLTPLNTEIKRCILSEEEISDDASPGLRHVRRSMKVLGDRVHSQLNALLNSNRSYLQDSVITMRDGRYCLPVKAEHKSQVSWMQDNYKEALGEKEKDFFEDYRTIARYRGIQCGVEYAEGFRMANDAFRVVPRRVLP